MFDATATPECSGGEVRDDTNATCIAHSAKSKWVVWRKGTQWPPRRFHHSRDSAVAEAERLARTMPGHKFHVIQWERKVWVRDDSRAESGGGACVDVALILRTPSWSDGYTTGYKAALRTIKAMLGPKVSA